MAWYNPFGKSKQRYAERDSSGDWLVFFNQYGDDAHVKKYSQDEAYNLAGSIAEIFFPIDMIADACSSLEYNIVDAETLLEVPFNNANIQRLLKKPNPFDSLSDIVYKGIFAKLSNGNSYDYTKIPDSFKNPNVDNITNLWALNPDKTKPVLLREIPNPFASKDKNEIVEYYKTHFFYSQRLNPRYVRHYSMFDLQINGMGLSPLKAVEKNINNLISVYSARYNVYNKNMNGGILAKDKVSENALEQAVNDPVSRDKILDDLKERNGLTGDKNFIGISSIPLKFIKTVASIQELQPFDETEADAVAIASIFGLDGDLIPKRNPSKYANKLDGERKLWQTVIKSMAIERGKEISEALYLPENVVLYPDFSKVEILQEDKKTAFEADKIMIENLTSLQEQGIDVQENYQKIKDKYDGIN